MVFVVVIKKINLSIDPENIINIMENNDIPLGKNMKYYEKRKVNKEDNTYTLRIKYYSFDENNKEMCNFHNELINYKWIKLQINDNLTFKICMKKIDYYNFVYGNFTYGDYIY